MAILTSIPGLFVSVVSLPNKQAFPEYFDDGEWTTPSFEHIPEDKRIAKYVECKPDATFAIDVSVGKAFDWNILDCENFTATVSVDGHQVHHTVLYRSHTGYRVHNLITHRRHWISATEETRQCLKFGRISKVDDANVARVDIDKEALLGVGDIIIRVYRSSILHNNHVYKYRSQQLKPLSEVAEKALKGRALSLGVGFGDIDTIHGAAPTKMVQYLDGINKPFSVFVFKYRTKEDLQSMLIIPRSPSPELRLQQSEPETSDEARLAALKAEIVKIKEEQNGNVRGQKRGRENQISASARQFKTSRNSNGKLVIDLLDD